MGGVAIELWVVLIEFGVVFIGGWGYLTILPIHFNYDSGLLLLLLL